MIKYYSVAFVTLHYDAEKAEAWVNGYQAFSEHEAVGKGIHDFFNCHSNNWSILGYRVREFTPDHQS